MTNRKTVPIILTCSLGCLALSAGSAGCRQDPAGHLQLQKVDPTRVIAAIRTLDHAKFDQLNYREKDHLLAVITKVHGMAYLLGPSEVALSVPGQPEYGEDLFRLHGPDKVLEFLEAEMQQRLERAAEGFKTLDETERNRDSRLILRLVAEYFQVLYVKQYGQLVREKFAEIGRSAQVPFQQMDAELVGANETGAAQKYLRAALESDAARMQEMHERINHLLKLVKDQKVESEFPFPPRAAVGLGGMQ